MLIKEIKSLQKRESLKSSAGQVKLMMQKKLRLEKQIELDKQCRANETSDARKLRLQKKTKCDKQHRASETNDARKLWLQKKSKVDKQHRTSETDDARQLHLTNKRKAYKSKMSLLNNQKETNGDKNDLASNFLTKNLTNITQDVSKTMYLNGFDMLRNGVLHDQAWVKWNMQQFSSHFHQLICIGLTYMYFLEMKIALVTKGDKL